LREKVFIGFEIIHLFNLLSPGDLTISEKKSHSFSVYINHEIIGLLDEVLTDMENKLGF
jgi:hypothetical protein